MALSPGGYVRQRGRGAAGAGGNTTPRAVNVQVAVRCRPLNARETSSGERIALKCDDGRREVVCAGVSGGPGMSKVPASLGSKTYTYDHVFGPDSSQEDVYDGVVKPIVEEVLEGYNCTVFAYGQTGTGKTHTMEGRRDDDVLCKAERRLPDNAGIIPRSVKQVFDHLRSISDEHSVRVSHLELYNEQLTDLLGPDDGTAAAGGGDGGLRVYDDSTKGTFVQGLDEVLVRSEEEIFAVLDKSATRRRTAETLMNKYSSRSHSVFSITIHIKESTPDGADLLKVGKLNLVDLAGSENVGRSGAVHDRAREAGNINQSLLTLGRVITALVEKHGHVPYRSSKLTRLLQESLGGKNKTCIIATVTAGSSSTEETMSTLDYAHRAKSIKNRPTVNQMISKHALLKDYTEEISKIKRELDATRSKNGVYLPPNEYATLQATVKEQSEWIAQLEAKGELSEKESAALKDKLTRTQDALSRILSELEETKGALKTTEEELTRTAEDLASKTQQRDEATCLVGAHVTAEVQLYQEGAALTNTLKEAVSDVGALHTRLDAGRDAESANLATVSALQSSTNAHLTGAGSAIAAFQERHTGRIQACQTRSGELATVVASRVDETSSSLGQLCEDLRALSQSHLDSAAAVDSEAMAANNDALAHLSESNSAQSKFAGAIANTLENATAAMTSSLAAIESSVTELRDLTSSSLTMQGQEMANFAFEQAELLASAQASIEAQLEAQSVSIASASQSVASSLDAQKAAVREAKETALANITNVLSTFIAAADESGSAVLQVESERTEELQNSVAGMRQAIEAQNEGCKDLSQRTVFASKAKIEETNVRLSGAAKAIIDSSSALGVTLGASINDGKEIVLNIARGAEGHAAELSSHLEALKAQRSVRADSGRIAAECQSEALSTRGNVMVSGLAETTTLVGQGATSLTNELTTVVDETSKFAHDLSESLSTGIGAELANLTLAVDVDASSAPSKRCWEYPTELTVAPEHDVLVGAFRKQKSLPPVPMPEGLPPRVRTSETSAMADLSGEAVCSLPGGNCDDEPVLDEVVQGDAANADTMEDAAVNEEGDGFATDVNDVGDIEESSGPLPGTDRAVKLAQQSPVLRDSTNSTGQKKKSGKEAGAEPTLKRSGIRPIIKRSTRSRRT